jgi:hypothetical protein
VPFDESTDAERVLLIGLADLGRAPFLLSSDAERVPLIESSDAERVPLSGRVLMT